jgi:hypothetical protein
MRPDAILSPRKANSVGMREVSTHEKVKHGSASVCWLSREPATAPMAAAVASDVGPR